MTLLITNEDTRRLPLSIKAAIPVIEDAFRQAGERTAENPARYRMGYAISPDGLTWTRRDDELGIDVSPTGWDSDAIEYAAEFQSNGDTWLLYNGNDFGVTGIGLAQRLD